MIGSGLLLCVLLRPPRPKPVRVPAPEIDWPLQAKVAEIIDHHNRTAKDATRAVLARALRRAREARHEI